MQTRPSALRDAATPALLPTVAGAPAARFTAPIRATPTSAGACACACATFATSAGPATAVRGGRGGECLVRTISRGAGTAHY